MAATMTAETTSTKQPAISPTENRDAMAAGILELLRPAVQEVDERVRLVRESQLDLRQQIEELDEVLKQLGQSREPPIELDPYVKKLMNSKRKIAVISNIVQNAQERVRKLQQRIGKESGKKLSHLYPTSTEAVTLPAGMVGATLPPSEGEPAKNT
ncbi:SNARE-associated protein Snapin-like isoform X1 [Acanthaster planci]|uniref:Biogenesis of lysosome-related organelles complex 1 subunit 7 n=1 Tax=Acanthaster planci TaxID=133434 RepID=A0A8B7YTI7_ACAPL|nr:SNARE-associated protein Snapin-like isoform X1 [Acanthaster planci]